MSACPFCRLGACECYGFDVSAFIGEPKISAEQAVELEAAIVRAMGPIAEGERIKVTDARIEGSKLLLSVTMPQWLAEEFGFVGKKKAGP